MNAIQLNANPTEYPSLTLSGNCGYEIQGDRIIITVDDIANRREAGNLSGSLALEIWALEKPYTGGQFAGLALAGTVIGQLAGGHGLAGCRYDLIFTEPPAGQWHLTLMLREWDGAGYVTRDHVNFNLPYHVSGKPLVTRRETDNVINVAFARPQKPAVQTGGDQPAKPAPKPAGVSVNTASCEEIAAVKGISKKLAENIAAARPYGQWEDLLKIKGMGAKLLAKLREALTL